MRYGGAGPEIKGKKADQQRAPRREETLFCGVSPETWQLNTVSLHLESKCPEAYLRGSHSLACEMHILKF